MPIIPSRRSAPEPTKSGRQKALLVGINYSTQTSQVESDYERLYAPGRDALAFRDLLIRLYGYRDVDITVMVDEADDRRLRPTRANIIQQIDALVKDAKAGDRFVFFFAGHSDQIASKSISEEDGLDEVIVPMDYNDSNSIVDNDLRKHLVDPLPAGAQLTAIFDSCHSGTLLDLDHYACNNIFRPWISKGIRRSASRWVVNIRKDAAASSIRTASSPISPSSPRIYQRRLSGPAVRSHVSSVGEFASAIGPRRVAKSASQSQGSRGFFAKSLHASGSLYERSRGALHVRTSTGALSHEAAEGTPVDIPLTLSPVASVVCNGFCEETPTARASVISLSACQDSQRTWEDGKGRSMTQMLIGILDKNPNPSFKDLMTSLSYSMHNMARSLHEWSRGKKKEVAVKKNSAEESAIPTELVNFQDPQLGSLTKLNMDQTFTM